MIRTALEFINSELESFFVDRENDAVNYSVGNISEINGIVNYSSSSEFNTNKHISITLCGVEELRTEGVRPIFNTTKEDKIAQFNAPIELNLMILCTAHSSDYATALRDLSNVIAFFQENAVFDDKKLSTLNNAVIDPDTKPWRKIQRLSLRILNLSFEQQNNLWATFGGKYMPSIVYKLSLLSFFSHKPKAITPAITEIGISEK